MVEHSTADWEVPSWTTVRVPCYYCHYLYGTHKDLSGPSIQTKFDLFVHILTAWVSWGGGRRGQKRLCHISCSSKLRAGAKRFWGVIGHVLKGGQPPTLPPQPFVENSFVTGIYTYQARFILNYRQIDNTGIYLCVLSLLYLNSGFHTYSVQVHASCHVLFKL